MDGEKPVLNFQSAWTRSSLFTTTHPQTDRFYEGDLPCFDQQSSKPAKAKRAPRRELVADGQLGRRVSLAARGNLSVRATFHNYPVELPPLPDQSSVCHDHTYA